MLQSNFEGMQDAWSDGRETRIRSCVAQRIPVEEQGIPIGGYGVTYSRDDVKMTRGTLRLEI